MENKSAVPSDATRADLKSLWLRAVQRSLKDTEEREAFEIFAELLTHQDARLAAIVQEMREFADDISTDIPGPSKLNWLGAAARTKEWADQLAALQPEKWK